METIRYKLIGRSEDWLKLGHINPTAYWLQTLRLCHSCVNCPRCERCPTSHTDTFIVKMLFDDEQVFTKVYRSTIADEKGAGRQKRYQLASNRYSTEGVFADPVLRGPFQGGRTGQFRNTPFESSTASAIFKITILLRKKGLTLRKQIKIISIQQRLRVGELTAGLGPI